MPRLALTYQSRSPRANGARSSARIRSAVRRASSTPPIPSRMIPNSSPPKRATVSPGRRQRWSRSPTRDEERVADGVAEALVDHLEPVEVEQDQGDRVVVALAGPGERVGDAVGQEVAVRQAGDRVVEGAALGGLEEMGVVEGDRGELGEPAQRGDLAARRTAARSSPTRGRSRRRPARRRSAGRRRRHRTPRVGMSVARSVQAS